MSKDNSHHHHICQACEAQCCQYYALQVDTPRSYADFDQIKWYLVHTNTNVFVDGREWFLEVLNPCRYLSKDFHCQIYETRPTICREYGISPKNKKNCHANESAIEHDHYFKTIEDLDKFVKKRFSRKKKVKKATRLKKI